MAKRSIGKRILIGVASIFGLAVVSLAVALSYTSPCGEPPALANDATRMNAVVYRCYGSSEVLEVEEIAKPVVADDEVLVRVRAAAVNPLEVHMMTGMPYVLRLSAGLGAPNYNRIGVDFAGTVEAVGKNVTRFKSGDDVFGGQGGALAEYITLREGQALAHKPANLTFEQAASFAVAATTALQGLRDKGHIQAGDKVLINGASGGVGTFAVQLAKSFGAEVTGVCSTRNVELVRSIGADHVIDYTQANFAEGEERYDLILDNVGNHPFLSLAHVLEPDGRLVSIGGPKHNRWIGPLTRILKANVLAPFVKQEFVAFISNLNHEDLDVLGELAAAGKLTPVIDRRYRLTEVRTAIDYVAAGRARGKVVVQVQPSVSEEGPTLSQTPG